MGKLFEPGNTANGGNQSPLRKKEFKEACRELCDNFEDPNNPYNVLYREMIPSKYNKASDRIRAAETFLAYGKGKPVEHIIQENIAGELKGKSDRELLLGLFGDSENLKVLLESLRGSGVDATLKALAGPEPGVEKAVDGVEPNT